MSCHNIGRGLNSVSKIVIKLYEEGRYDKETARQLLCTCRKGVNWCDGNEEEAVEDVIEAGYCGLCMTKTEQISDIYDNNLKYPDKYKLFDPFDKSAAHFFLCPECKEKVLASYQSL